MIIGLIILLIAILILPFFIKQVEHNLEIFLFLMGLIAVTITKLLSVELFVHIFQNEMLYFITGAVLIAGILFKFTASRIRAGMERVVGSVPISVILFLAIVILGVVSSIITAIIASLVLVEIIQALPVGRKYKVEFCVISCFSIGLGAALTPIGEPLSTIVVSILSQDFLYLIRSLGVYIIPGIIALGLFGAFYVGKRAKLIDKEQIEIEAKEHRCYIEADTYTDIVTRALKIFLFVVALELLGTGFKPLINTYIIHLDSMLLYWINMISAVLDNATLAAAEISPMMSQEQVTAILMGLLISGGMLIPGNIPNIISACKLNIGSKDWAKLGVPLGLIILLVFFMELFVLKTVSGLFISRL